MIFGVFLKKWPFLSKFWLYSAILVFPLWRALNNNFLPSRMNFVWTSPTTTKEAFPPAWVVVWMNNFYSKVKCNIKSSYIGFSTTVNCYSRWSILMEDIHCRTGFDHYSSCPSFHTTSVLLYKLYLFIFNTMIFITGFPLFSFFKVFLIFQRVVDFHIWLFWC